jgi:hypothetical protein
MRKPVQPKSKRWKELKDDLSWLLGIVHDCPFNRLGELVSVHQRLGNCLQGVPFKAIVHEDE